MESVQFVETVTGGVVPVPALGFAGVNTRAWSWLVTAAGVPVMVYGPVPLNPGPASVPPPPESVIVKVSVAPLFESAITTPLKGFSGASSVVDWLDVMPVIVGATAGGGSVSTTTVVAVTGVVKTEL